MEAAGPWRAGLHHRPASSASTPIRSAAEVDDARVLLASFEDDDIKDSDRWRLTSDASTVSSRVTTPDLVSPRLLQLPSLASIISRAVPFSPPPLPPPSVFALQAPRTGGMGRRRGRGRAKGRGRGSPKNHNGTSRPQGDNPSPLPSPPPPPPPWIENPGPTAPKVNQKLDQVPEQQQSTRPLQPLRISARDDDPTPNEDSPKLRPATSPGQRSKSRRDDSRASQADDGSSSSGSSDTDPFSYRNRWHFPPQLPAGPAHGSSTFPARSRSLATNQIAAWVSRFEKSQSPARFRLDGASRHLQPIDTESCRGDDSQPSGDDSSHGGLELLWQQLKEKRVKVEKTRAEMRTSRKELRRMRRDKDAADNDFMSVVRPMLVPQGGPRQTPADLLDLRLARMQRLRDDYQVLESSYERLESTLDMEECDLGTLETQFFSLLAHGQTAAEPRPDVRQNSGGEAHENAGLGADMPPELRGISRDGPAEEAHPLYTELMSAIGNLENAKEEYEDLLCVKDRYDLERSLNRTARQQDLDEMEEFLGEFASEEHRMKDSVATMEAEVQRLKALCEERRVMKKHLSVRVEYALNPKIKYEDMDLDDAETILQQHRHGTGIGIAHPDFAELLSRPEHVLASPEPLTALGMLIATTKLPNDDPSKPRRKRLAAKEFAIDSLMRDCRGENRADLVNRWLLQQLRTSPLQAVLLRSTFLASRALRIRDPWRWQCDVLYYWWRDETMAVPERSVSREEGGTSRGSERSSRLGTPQLSRAASEGEPSMTNHKEARMVGGYGVEI